MKKHTDTNTKRKIIKKLDSSQRIAAKKLLRYLGRYRLLLIISFLCAMVSVITTLYVPVLTGEAVDCIAAPGKVQFDALRGVLMKIGITVSLTVVFQWLMNLVNNRVTYRVVQDLRRDAQTKIETLPLAYLDRHKTGDIINRVISDADQTGDGLLMGLTQLFSALLTIVGTIFFMLSLNVSMTLVVILITPLSLFVAAFIAAKTYRLFLKQSQLRGEQTGFTEEILHNQKTVLSLHQEQATIARFVEINDRLSSVSLKALFSSSITNPSTRFINGLVYTGVGITGAFAAISGRISVGQLVSFLSYSNQYTKPFNEISGVIGEMQNALASAARIFDLLAQPSETEVSSPAALPCPVQGEICFSDVSFSYTKDRPLIRDLNLTFRPGEKIAIVGPTGCGKTTVINLLMRFYDPVDGVITLDGIPLTALDRASLRSHIGMVLQETWLMHATIRDNIRFGAEKATDEEIISAAKRAYAHGFIMRLDHGYDTVIGEGGQGLSEGQRQLLCIARIMLIHPSILILDEATSSIDTRTEQKIGQAFDELTAGKTSFIVAHRLSTIRNSDIILVMRDGNVVETGKHEQLLQQHGFYEELYHSQFVHTVSSDDS